MPPNLTYREHILLAALCTVWVVLQIPHLQLDPWNDELFTLQHFVLVPVRRSIVDYPVPNNHILFSLCMNVFRRFARIHDVQGALDGIVLLRIFPLVCSLGTIVSVYLTARRRAGAVAGAVAAMLLMGSVPFFNYAAQLRGYSLSMFLLAVLLQQLLSARPRMTGIAATTAAFIWVLPSNLYVLAAVIGALMLCPPIRAGEGRRFWFRNIIAGRTETKLPLLYNVLTGLVAGGLIGGLLYLPVLDQLKSFTEGRSAGFSAIPLKRTLPVVLWHFMSGRWPLLLLPFAYLAVRLYHRQLAFPERLLGFSLITVLSPFLVSALRGEGAPDRVYLPLLPIVCLGWGVLSGRAIEALRARTRLIVTVLYGLCCGLALLAGSWSGVEKVYSDRLKNERCADLYYQYYLFDFSPRERAKRFMKRYRNEAPIINAAIQDVELEKYLRIEGATVLPADSLQRFARRDSTVFAIMDGPDLNAGQGVRLPTMEMPGYMTQPGIYRIRWQTPDRIR